MACRILPMSLSFGFAKRAHRVPGRHRGRSMTRPTYRIVRKSSGLIADDRIAKFVGEAEGRGMRAQPDFDIVDRRESRRYLRSRARHGQRRRSEIRIAIFGPRQPFAPQHGLEAATNRPARLGGGFPKRLLASKWPSHCRRRSTSHHSAATRRLPSHKQALTASAENPAGHGDSRPT